MVKRTKIDAEKILGDVPEKKTFWCSDGQILKNLPELGTALKKMSEETFRYHAIEAKNDFSKWVREVIGDEKLARDLQKSLTKAQAAKNVAERMIWLRSRKVAK